MLTFGHCQNWSISGIVRIGLRKTTILKLPMGVLAVLAMTTSLRFEGAVTVAEVARPRLRIAERSDSAAISDGSLNNCDEDAVDKEIKNVVELKC